jgi:hypothetical protein
VEWFNQLIYDGMMYAVRKFIEEAVNEYMGSLVSLREIALDILASQYLTNAILYVQGIAALVLILKVAFEAKAIHIMRLDGSSDADPMGLLKGAAAAAAIIATAPWIIHQVWIFGLSVQRDISQIPGTDIGSEQDALLNFFTTCATSPGVLFLGVIVAVVVYILVVFQSLVYAVDLTVVSIMGLWMALGLTNPQSNAFSVWWKDLQGTALIPALQLLILKGAFALWLDFDLNAGARLLLFIVFMYGAYRVPQRVQMYVGYTSSGVGRTSVNMAQTLISRMMMRR